jgi:hypothetical protein
LEILGFQHACLILGIGSVQGTLLLEPLAGAISKLCGDHCIYWILDFQMSVQKLLYSFHKVWNDPRLTDCLDIGYLFDYGELTWV